KRLGVEGDWEHYYSTMAYPAEAIIASELMKFAMNGALFRGSKPVMWSVVEKTALAEAEVEYQDYTSDTVWVKFPLLRERNGAPLGRWLDAEPTPIKADMRLGHVSVAIWTTTPWTIPGNRAICYSPKIAYGLYEVISSPPDTWLKGGQALILADRRAADVFKAARLGKDDYKRVRDVSADDLAQLLCAHPLRELGYGFDVPLLAGDHVTDD